MQKLFIPNDGRPSRMVSSIKEIKEYMGEIMDEFGPIEIHDNDVLTQISGQYMKIGKIK